MSRYSVDESRRKSRSSWPDVLTPIKKGPPVKKYGNRNVSKMLRQINALRAAIRAEGTPAIQSAWDAVEEHIDYAYRADAPVELSRKA